MSLTLALSGLSVTLDRFLDSNCPRTKIQGATVEFSLNGTPALSGSVFQSKHLWTINAIINAHQRRMIDAIAYEFHVSRRNLQDCNILVYDTTAAIVERSRSRSIVPNTVELSINNGSHVAYYPICKAAITEGPKFADSGHYDIVTMSLTETILVAP